MCVDWLWGEMGCHVVNGAPIPHPASPLKGEELIVTGVFMQLFAVNMKFLTVRRIECSLGEIGG